MVARSVAEVLAVGNIGIQIVQGNGVWRFLHRGEKELHIAV
jgi:hypothetical protein